MKKMLPDIKNNIFPSIICLLLLTGILSCTIRSPKNKSANKSVYWDTTVIGNGQAYEICAMIDSVRQGIAISYDSLWRKTAEITYVNGECYGPFIRYNAETGRIFIRAFYKNDMWDGLFTDYYENGNVESIVFFKDGKYHGLISRYKENGQLSQKILYDNDTIKEVIYDDGSYLPPPIEQ